MTIHDYNEQYAAYAIYGGLVLAAIGFIWLYVRAARAWGGWLYFPPAVLLFPLVELRKAAGPLALLALGLVLTAAPAAVSRLVPVDLGARESMVNGERHVTLTGWDQKNYVLLQQKSDAVIVQMANDDVTDETLELLADFTKLRELDVQNSAVTDAGLAAIAKLPALEVLYLNKTAVTGIGVAQHLSGHSTLKVLWLRGTKVDQETADAIKAAKPGRRVIVDAPGK